MCNYKGNVGHLMQHWTLCELVDFADRENAPGLSFIDAHAMAPIGNRRISADARFDRARVCPPCKRSVYQKAWHQMVPISGYPNSAAFVSRVWPRELSMLLCEIDPKTIAEIDTWIPFVQSQSGCKRAKVYPGNWRDRFKEGLPSPSELGLPNESLTLVSFDPYICSKNRRSNRLKKREKGNVYPNDIQLSVRSMRNLECGILVQLSTYGTMGGNSQEAVIESATPILAASGFTQCATVRGNGNMMSLVYERDVSWSGKLRSLPERFNNWLGEI